MRGLKISQSITDRQDASLGIYFKDVSRFPLLTPEEEPDVIEKAQAGDKRAFDKLITSNLRFVISVAKQYQNKGLPLIDLIQYGNEGLIECIPKFDITRGYKFISFAVWWIRQSITKALTENSRLVRIPLNQLANINKINKVIDKWEQEEGLMPSTEDLIKETGLSKEKIDRSFAATTKTISLETPFKDEDASCLLDILPNNNIPSLDKDVIINDRAKVIDKVISKMPNQKSDIIRMIFGIGIEPMSLDEIANRFGVCVERIRQLQRESLKDLQKIKYKELKEVL